MKGAEEREASLSKLDSVNATVQGPEEQDGEAETDEKGGQTERENVAVPEPVQEEEKEEDEEKRLPFSLRIRPCAVFGFCLLVEIILVFYAAGVYQPWEARSNNIGSMAFISRKFVESYTRGLPRWYTGNETTMQQGFIFNVTFVLPLLSCEFLKLKDRYIKAVANAHLVTPDFVTLTSPTTCLNLTTSGKPDVIRPITMHVIVYDMAPVADHLELDLSSSWRKDKENVNPAGQVQRGEDACLSSQLCVCVRIHFFCMWMQTRVHSLNLTHAPRNCKQAGSC